jgi:hypothetical protein
METPITPTPVRNSICRPIGLWIATIWAGLLAGLFPFGLLLLFYFGPAKGAEIISVTQFAISAALSASIIVSAVAAWRGISIARYALVVLVLIHYGMITYQNYNMAIAGVEVRGSSAIPWVRAIRSPITGIIIAWYLLFSRRARAFFHAPNSLV